MPVYSLDGIAPHLPQEGEYWIAPDAHVIGKVTLARDVGVWFGAVLRGDNEMITIGEGTNVQEHATLHTDIGFPLTVGKNCTIGHRALLHGCTVGDNTLIGMGSMVMNGAKVGSNCLVGAGALVTEGKVFGDNALIVGVPAKAIRTLDEKAIAGLTLSGTSYQKNWKRYAKGLVNLGSDKPALPQG